MIGFRTLLHPDSQGNSALWQLKHARIGKPASLGHKTGNFPEPDLPTTVTTFWTCLLLLLLSGPAYYCMLLLFGPGYYYHSTLLLGHANINSKLDLSTTMHAPPCCHACQIISDQLECTTFPVVVAVVLKVVMGAVLVLGKTRSKTLLIRSAQLPTTHQLPFNCLLLLGNSTTAQLRWSSCGRLFRKVLTWKFRLCCVVIYIFVNTL